MEPAIGVLAVQGDFDAHRRRLEQLGARVHLVRRIDQLKEIEALVIPGGESTAMLRLLGEDGLAGLTDFARSRPVFGTCAGTSLLAAEVDHPSQPTLGAIDIRVHRNAYGRQIDSAVRYGTIEGLRAEMIFIRAPRIVSVGPGVRVLGTLDGEPVAVRHDFALATTFHPELSSDKRLHRMFLEMVHEAQEWRATSAGRASRGLSGC